MRGQRHHLCHHWQQQQLQCSERNGICNTCNLAVVTDEATSDTQIREVCTRCAQGGLGLELSFNPILPSLGSFQQSRNDASPLIALHHQSIS